MFVIEMNQPGVEVRPIRTMTGGASFNEVFLTDAWVPADALLSDLEDGWSVARSTLTHERSAMGQGRTSGIAAVPRLRLLARESNVLDDSLVRQQLADIEIRHRGLEILAVRQRHEASVQGEAMCINKLQLTALLQRVSALASDILGDRLLADSGEWGTFGWSRFINGVPGMRIAGGTDEILYNILAERVLGLPREAKPK